MPQIQFIEEEREREQLMRQTHFRSVLPEEKKRSTVKSLLIIVGCLAGTALIWFYNGDIDIPDKLRPHNNGQSAPRFQ